MKIVCWSPTPFAGRKSTHLLLLAMQTIQEEGGEQLVLHTDYRGSGPEHYLLSGSKRSRMIQKKEFGVELLCKMLRCGPLTKEMAISASYTFADNKLHVLPAGNEGFYQENERKVAEDIEGIMQYADTVFQNVWVELPAERSVFSDRILKAADCVIINLAQSPLEPVKLEGLPELKREFFLVGVYEKQCIYTTHNWMLLYPRLRGRCEGIPYHPGYLTACCAGKAEAFLLRGMLRNREETQDFFFEAVQKVYQRWKKVGLSEDENKNKKQKECATTGI